MNPRIDANGASNLPPSSIRHYGIFKSGGKSTLDYEEKFATKFSSREEDLSIMPA